MRLSSYSSPAHSNARGSDNVIVTRSSKDSSLAPISHDDGGKAGETGENYVAYEWHTRLSRNTRERTIEPRGDLIDNLRTRV